MRHSFRLLVLLVVVGCLIIPSTVMAADKNPASNSDSTSATATAAPTSGASPSVGGAANTNLLDLLVKKGVLTPSEASSLRSTSGSAGMTQLLKLLETKGLVSDSEAAELKAAADADPDHSIIDTESGGVPNFSLTTQQATQTQPVAETGPTVVPAIAPLRVLPIDIPTKDGLSNGIRLGSGERMMPYGFIKSTMAYDSYNPYGDDFIKPLFLAGGTNSAPGGQSEFHIKARSSRIGTKFEWPDVSKNITITGQLEGDFEGNFSAADNRTVSSIRSSAFSLRLAYGRIDWNEKPNTDIFFEAGQDWSIFGSSSLMNLLETTFFGAYWGNIYERTPQFRLGMIQRLGGERNWRISPEFAIAMPSEGNVPGSRVTCPGTAPGGTGVCTLTNLGITSQLGYGEQQGADSGKPELESRVVLQFQLDEAPGVVPAQILWSGFYTSRTMDVLSTGVPAAYTAAFPNGASTSSNGYGNQVAIQLPTRWATLELSGYIGADLRWFFGGQTNSYYSYTGGLTGIADGFGVDYNTAVFGTNAAGHAVFAPQLPIRGYGGNVQLGLPISRWFDANPKGRNAGWQAYLEYGIDATNASDFYKAKAIGADGGGPIKSTLKGLTVFYKMNPWVQFGFEESDYTSYAVPAISGADAGICNVTKVGNKPVCNATDWRTEFGPIFTF
jgi:hypothetical protein